LLPRKKETAPDFGSRFCDLG
jgi:hypothetical protein